MITGDNIVTKKTKPPSQMEIIHPDTPSSLVDLHQDPFDLAISTLTPEELGLVETGKLHLLGVAAQRVKATLANQYLGHLTEEMVETYAEVVRVLNLVIAQSVAFDPDGYVVTYANRRRKRFEINSERIEEATVDTLEQIVRKPVITVEQKNKLRQIWDVITGQESSTPKLLPGGRS